MVELPAEAFAVRRSVYHVPLADHVSHLRGGIPARLVVDALRTGGEAFNGRSQLGVSGVGLFLHGLCCLDSRESRGARHHHRGGKPGSVTPDD